MERIWSPIEDDDARDQPRGITGRDSVGRRGPRDEEQFAVTLADDRGEEVVVARPRALGVVDLDEAWITKLRVVHLSTIRSVAAIRVYF